VNIKNKNKNQNKNKILTARVLKRLNSIQQLPKEGIVAGQSVCSAIVEELNITGINPVYNDIDIFRPAQDKISKRLAVITSTHQDYELEMDNYGRINEVARQISKYRIVDTNRNGMLNNVFYQNTAINEIITHPGFKIEKIIKSFDMNATQVGIDLKTGILFGTDNFWNFIESKQLEIVNLHTPHHTMVRYFNKVRDLGCYTNLMYNITLGHIGILISNDTYQAPNRFGGQLLPKAISNTELQKYFKIIANKHELNHYQTYSLEIKEFLVNNQGKKEIFTPEDFYKIYNKLSITLEDIKSKYNIKSIIPIIRLAFFGSNGAKRLLININKNYKNEQISSIINCNPDFVIGKKNISFKHLETINKFLQQQRQMSNIIIKMDIEKAVQFIKNLKKLEKKYSDMVYSISYLNKLTDLKKIEQKLREELKNMDRELTMRSFNSICDDEFSIEEITNQLDLYLEGLNMNHCVGGYHNRIKNKSSMILKATHKEDKHLNTTIEIKFSKKLNEEDNYFSVVQIMHKNNVKPNDQTTKKLKKLMKKGMPTYGEILENFIF